MLITKSFPVTQSYMKPRFGTSSYKVNVVMPFQLAQKIADVLPFDLPLITFCAKESYEKMMNLS